MWQIVRFGSSQTGCMSKNGHFNSRKGLTVLSNITFKNQKVRRPSSKEDSWKKKNVAVKTEG